MKNTQIAINNKFESIPLSNGIFNIYNQKSSIIHLEVQSQDYIFPE